MNLGISQHNFFFQLLIKLQNHFGFPSNINSNIQWEELRNDKNSLKPTQPYLEIFVDQCNNATPKKKIFDLENIFSSKYYDLHKIY